MPLRLMQIFVPDTAEKIPTELLEHHEFLASWRDSEASQTVLELLVPADETEPLMDKLEERYSNLEGFHVLLYPVEAAIPRIPSEPDEKKEADGDQANDREETPRISREELYNEVNGTLGVTRTFICMTVLSTIVAAVGLLRDDVAVIIAAMVIAPLLGPNVAMSLATTLGDTTLLRRSLKTNLVGIATAFAFAVLIGAIFGANPEVPAIAGRTILRIGDLLLALSAGAAGTLAFTSGVAGAVIGVMVAVALVPPLVVSGMLLGAGYVHLAVGALLLALANVICINIAGVITFFLQGVRPRSWWEAEHAKSSMVKAMVLWIILLAALVAIICLTKISGRT
jgi:uncharacterized hydrophobic protein (TIGR00341 family)